MEAGTEINMNPTDPVYVGERSRFGLTTETVEPTNQFELNMDRQNTVPANIKPETVCWRTGLTRAARARLTGWENTKRRCGNNRNRRRSPGTARSTPRPARLWLHLNTKPATDTRP